MSDKEHSEPREDAAKKRREYLAKLAIAQANGSFALLLMILFMVAGLWFSLELALSLFREKPSGQFLFAAIVCVGATTNGWMKHQEYTKRAKSLPYVPPVAEQLANLPADEVLLRGSDQPSAAPDELLRAAHEGTDTPADQLLRADQAPTGPR